MKSFPFDSLALYQDEKTGLWMGDRQGSAQDVRDINKIFWKNGVCMAFENAFQVTPGEGMNVIVAPGVCGIEGTLGIEDSERGLTLQASSSEDRIDTIVLRLNLNVEARKIDLYVKTGTAQAVPVRPQLTRSESVWELGIADIFVAKNSGAISLARITDTRLQTERCGMMTPLIEVDTTTFYNQLQAAIDERTAELEEQTQIAVDLAQSAIDGTTAGNLQNQITANKTPAGCVMPYAGSNTPNGWLPCDGSLVLREEYPALFSAIGTTYGAGDGSTTFALPNLQGRFPLGVSGSHALGSTGGAETVTLATSQIPAHKHSTTLIRGSADNNAYGLTGSQAYGGSVLVNNGAGTNVTKDSGNTGGGQAHNNMPPFITLNYIISTGDYD